MAENNSGGRPRKKIPGPKCDPADKRFGVRKTQSPKGAPNQANHCETKLFRRSWYEKVKEDLKEIKFFGVTQANIEDWNIKASERYST